jgi:hypothetical protein
MLFAGCNPTVFAAYGERRNTPPITSTVPGTISCMMSRMATIPIECHKADFFEMDKQKITKL